MSDELKPCPFCSGKAKVEYNLVGLSAVYCQECSARAIKKDRWNKRHCYIGDYFLTEYSDKSFWIENKLGEGMEVDKKKFMDLIDKFFEENF